MFGGGGNKELFPQFSFVLSIGEVDNSRASTQHKGREFSPGHHSLQVDVSAWPWLLMALSARGSECFLRGWPGKLGTGLTSTGGSGGISVEMTGSHGIRFAPSVV